MFLEEYLYLFDWYAASIDNHGYPRGGDRSPYSFREISSLRSINHGRSNMVCNGDVNVYEYQNGMLAIHRHASLMPMQYIY